MLKKEATGYRLILGYLGVFLITIGIICLIPLFLLIPYQGEASVAKNFIIPGVSSIAVGILLTLLIVNREKAKLGKHQDSLLLVLIWVIAILICSVPFMLGGMKFTDAVFEATSGFSTTGLTRFYEFEYQALTQLHIYQFYRCLLLFFGGVGLVLIVSSAISDRFSLKLYTAEGHNDKLLPNLRKSASLILLIYIVYIAIGTGAYILAGMEPFDSVCHSISALATGGFSTKSGGLLEAGKNGNMIAIEIISCVLMVLGGTNFLTHMFILRGKWKRVFKDCEVRFFALLTIVMVPLMFVSIGCYTNWSDPITSLRYGAFTFFSAVTTTGFSNVPTVAVSHIATLGKMLGEAALFLIILTTIIGGGMGSTAGGVKQFRFVISLKTLYWSMKEKASSTRNVYPHYVNRFGYPKEISPTDSYEAFRYMLVYILVVALGTFLIVFIGIPQNVSFMDAFFEFNNAISSAGLTSGLTATASTGILWVLIVGMFLGRLEIFAVYFAFYRMGRDILRKETV